MSTAEPLIREIPPAAHEGPAVADAIVANPQATKILVAVHGIGNQSRFATAQAVASAFCRYYDKPSAIPLGRFHTTPPEPLMLDPDLDPGLADRIGFAEIYWADIPREVVDQADTLEGAQAWAKTLVERVRLRQNPSTADPKARLSDDDFDMLETVLKEAIQTVDILDRLLLFAKLTALPNFDLKRLLADFLGDVQLVTEFGSIRERLLKQFRDGMDRVHECHPDAEIYIISHSEGTVVSFLGLLEAFTAQPAPPWLGRIKGYMTIGSPLNKHVVCWPRLWSAFEKSAESTRNPIDAPIPWQNYFDKGDLIAFKLDRTRRWIAEHGWERSFEFPEENDHEFSRYVLPGKAHNDYFTDPAVFGHFIQNVVKPASKPGDSVVERPDYREPPKTRWWVPPLAYATFLIPLILLFVGCYAFYKVVHANVSPHEPLSGLRIFGDVALIVGLLGSITTVARVARLSRPNHLHVLAAALFAGALAAYCYGGSDHLLEALSFPNIPRLQTGNPIVDRFDTNTNRICFAAVVLCLINYLGARWFPRLGMKLLIVGGSIVSFLMVASYVAIGKEAGHGGQLWPIVLCGILFFYLWWLAAMIFDLIFIWMRYIRRPVAAQKLDELLPMTMGAQADEITA